MKKNKIIIISIVSLIILSALFLSFNMFEDDTPILENKKKNNNNHNNLIAMMLETGYNSKDYQESTSNSWPSSGYTFNETLSKCVNGSEISYDKSANKVTIIGETNDKCYVYFDKAPESAKATILANSKVNTGTPDFSNPSATDEGLYQAEDDYGTSYYFRGAVENNYIHFDNYYWRIIRIMGDDSIRMIYDGTYAHYNGDPSSDRMIQATGSLGEVAYGNSGNISSGVVGYMYFNSSYIVNEISLENYTHDSSPAKMQMDAFFRYSINDESLIVDSRYCNDITNDGSGYYNGAYRLAYSKNPSLKCSNSYYNYTVSDHSGNTLLSYPIGMITADEVAMAGGVSEYSNYDYYLYTSYEYHTLTPYGYANPDHHELTESSYTTYVVDESGSLNFRPIKYEAGLRPVITLSSSVKLSGTGTMDDPYEVIN